MLSNSMLSNTDPRSTEHFLWREKNGCMIDDMKKYERVSQEGGVSFRVPLSKLSHLEFHLFVLSVDCRASDPSLARKKFASYFLHI